MATNEEQHITISRMRRARKLLVAADIMVDEAMGTATLLERWEAVRNFVNRLEGPAWEELARRANLMTPPSEATIAMVREGATERLSAKVRAMRLNHGNNVTPIR